MHKSQTATKPKAPWWWSIITLILGGGTHPSTWAVTFFTRRKFAVLLFDAPPRPPAAVQMGLSLLYGLGHTWTRAPMSLSAYRSQVPLDTCMRGGKSCLCLASTHLGSGACKRAQRTPDATVPLAMLREIMFTMQSKFFQPFLACTKSLKAARTGFLWKAGVWILNYCSGAFWETAVSPSLFQRFAGLGPGTLFLHKSATWCGAGCCRN